MSQPQVTKKVGEIEEIRSCLRAAPQAGNTTSKRIALRKVIALMTSGIDTAALFPDVIMSCFTDDIVCKKMIYLYLATQSKGKEDLAVLAINALVKECHDQSPVVRGLALRSLSAMHVCNLLEYLIPVLEKGLADSSAYVRKAAVCALLRLLRRSPSDFYGHKGFDHAVRLLGDPDVQVSSNALELLLEVSRRESAQELASEMHSPFTVSRALLYQLLNRLRQVNEWQQIQVLHLCLQYTPVSEDEMFEMMNLLDERLESTNSGVVLACSRVFLHLTQNAPAVQRKVFERLREPLLMVASSAATETAYAALCHIKLLVKRDARLFAGDFKVFFCDVNEPSCNKCVKMDILAAVASPASAAAILDELVACSEDRSAAVARTAIATLSLISLRLPDTLGAVLTLFTDFITLGLEDVRGATLAVLTDVLRQRVPLDAVRPILQTVMQCYTDAPFHDDESRIALLWLLGEYGEYVAEAPYLMELFLHAILKESAPLRLQLLTSAATLFFKRPPEMQRCLGGIFHALLNDFTNADVLDKALLYYRLLRTDVAAAARVIGAPKAAVSAYVEDMDAAMLDRLMAEFDTLSIVYGVPEEKFLARERHRTSGEAVGEDAADDEVAPVVASAEAHREAGMEHLFGAAAPASTGQLRLSPGAELEPQTFQQQWTAATHAATFTVGPRSARPALDAEAVEAALEACHIFVLASGVQDGAHKLLLYAEVVAPLHAWFLLEALVAPSGTVRLTAKCVEPLDLADVETVVRSALQSTQ